MAERTLVISDIHGCYDEFNQLLDKFEYAPDKDKLLLLGDYVDRGPRSMEVVEQLIAMSANLDFVALRGNHDQRFTDVILGDNPLMLSKFLEHGGIPTLKSYCGSDWDYRAGDEDSICYAKEWIQSHYAHHLSFLSSLPLYHEDDYHIYVHAGLNPLYKNWKEQPERDFMWIRDPFFNNPTVVDKTVLFGHTKTTEIHDKSSIWFGKDKIGLDGGCAYGLQLNGLEIREPKEYRVFHVVNSTYTQGNSVSQSS